jgi:3-phenylpropionate/cinnamic acid dioxygenase small subunit
MTLSTKDISDRLLISELLDTYAAAVDSRDWSLLETVFTEDAILDYSAFGGPRGPFDEVVPWLEKSLALFAASQHLISNKMISLDGDEATARCSLFNPMVLAGDKPDVLLVGGGYADRLRRIGDGWRIAERVVHPSWSHVLASG